MNVYRIELGDAAQTRLYFVDLPGYGYARGGAQAAHELRAIAEAYLSPGKRLRPDQPPPRLRRSAGASAKAERGAKPPSESAPPPLVAESSGDQLRRGLAVAGANSVRATAEGPASTEESRRSAGISKTPTAALLLVDSRHPSLDADRRAAEWLAQPGIVTHVVATKIDKLTRAERARNLETLGNTFGKAVLPVSAATGEGLDELWRMIVRIVRDADRHG